MHSPGSRWEFRECAVAYFGFFACVPLVRIVVTSHFKLSMSFLSSLASMVEFLNQMKRNHRY